MEPKRKVEGLLAQILKYDKKLTNIVTNYLLQFHSFKTLQIHGTLLDWSCNGVVWFPLWIALIWLLNKKDLYEMQINMLIGLTMDVIIVAVVKAFVRRRRPSIATNVNLIGPDKFSFPSGHASRAFFILLFYTALWPLPKVCWMPLFAWAICVALSRLLLGRHYILDIFAGILISVLENVILKLFWIDNNKALNLIEYVATDYLADGGLDD